MTAVSWLERELDRIERVYNLDEQKSYANEKRIEAFQQALSMEREQKQKDFEAGREQVIRYIENDAEIMVPISRFFNEDGSHITKKQYGIILLEILCQELRDSTTIAKGFPDYFTQNYGDD